MQLRYDFDADIIFVTVRAAEGGESGGQRLNATRVAHVDHAGRIFAYEFLNASRGVSLAGIDYEDSLRIREVVKPVIPLAGE